MKKALGRGLDLLFESSTGENLFKKGLKYEEKGNFIQAFYFYMKAAETPSSYTSKALNNAGAILAEHGFLDEALGLLEKALEYDPNNQEAKENLEILKGGML